MDSMSAFAMGKANQHKELMVFDWEKAAWLIKERKPKRASAGLRGDWEWTGDDIYENGAPVPSDNTYTFLASTWATPELDLDGEIVDCYKMESEVPGWGSDTYWPPEALAIING